MVLLFRSSHHRRVWEGFDFFLFFIFLSLENVIGLASHSEYKLEIPVEFDSVIANCDVQR
jgi:hypothetical protein